MSKLTGAARKVFKALSKRATLYGLNLIIASVVMLAILVVIQLIVMHNNALNRRLDLTEAKLFSISDQSAKILESLHKDVKVTAFYRDRNDKMSMDDLLTLYGRHSARFTYDLLDLDKSPQEAKQLGVKTYNKAVVQCGDKSEEILFSDPSEEDLTNALIKVTRDVDKIIYFTTGHGEKDIDKSGVPGAAASLKDAVKKEAYKVKTIAVAREMGGIPAECSALVIMGPETDLYTYELEQVDRYLREGGRVLAMIDPETAPGLVSFLDRYGVVVKNDYVLDPNPMSQFIGGNYLMPLVMSYSTRHEITKDFNLACLVPIARSVQVKSPLPDNIKGEWLARAGHQSWGETNFALLKQANKARFDRGSDTAGPVTLAAAMTVDVAAEGSELQPLDQEEAKRPEARLVVIGDSDMGSDQYLRPENKNFLLNAISWLVEEEDLISIRPKGRKHAPVIFSDRDRKVLFFRSVIVIPGSVVAAGGLVFLRRRRYR